MRNAVKATVDAYDGTVTLYAWDEQDPILKAWRSAFPGVVQDRARHPRGAAEHLRYPEDLFKVQRYQLARYHVTDAKDFYEDNDRWEVPDGPERDQQQAAAVPAVREQARRRAGRQRPPRSRRSQVFSLTSVYVPRNKNSLAAFMSVDSDATDEDFGQIQVFQLLQRGHQRSTAGGQPDQLGPGRPRRGLQVHQRRHPDDLRQPAGAAGRRRADVRPAAVRRPRLGSSPRALQFVLVSYGDQVGIGKTLDEAIVDVLGGEPEDTPDRRRPIPRRRPTPTRRPAAAQGGPAASSAWRPRRTPRPTGSRRPATPPAGPRPSRRPATTSTAPCGSSTSGRAPRNPSRRIQPRRRSVRAPWLRCERSKPRNPGRRPADRAPRATIRRMSTGIDADRIRAAPLRDAEPQGRRGVRTVLRGAARGARPRGHQPGRAGGGVLRHRVRRGRSGRRRPGRTAGDWFGDIAIVEHTRRTASVRATTPLTLIAMTDFEFRRLEAEHPEIAATITTTMQERLGG